MNKGLLILLRSLGLEIDPVQIEEAWEKSKNALPELAQAFDRMDKRQERLEQKLDELLARQKLITEDVVARSVRVI